MINSDDCNRRPVYAANTVRFCRTELYNYTPDRQRTGDSPGRHGRSQLSCEFCGTCNEAAQIGMKSRNFEKLDWNWLVETIC